MQLFITSVLFATINIYIYFYLFIIYYIQFLIYLRKHHQHQLIYDYKYDNFWFI